MVTVVFLSSAAQYNKQCFEFDTQTIVWVVFAIFTSTLTACWDIYYDFGLFNSFDAKQDLPGDNLSLSGDVLGHATRDKQVKQQPPRRQYPFLRKQLVYPVWVYYFAIFEDFVLRFSWIVTISLTEFSGIEAGIVISLLAPLEMFRRFVWNCIRLENEQLNNCGMFREARDIPLQVVAPIDESHVKKVIVMMDSKDGAALRDTRLNRRRTLRTGTVTFLELDDDSLFDVSRTGQKVRF